MTSTKLIKENDGKATIFDVKIDITDCKEFRDVIVKQLRKVDWEFASELADIIEKG